MILPSKDIVDEVLLSNRVFDVVTVVMSPRIVIRNWLPHTLKLRASFGKQQDGSVEFSLDSDAVHTLNVSKDSMVVFYDSVTAGFISLQVHLSACCVGFSGDETWSTPVVIYHESRDVCCSLCVIVCH